MMMYGQTGQDGIYGWRKRCQYMLLLGLTVIVLGNLGTTLLLLHVIDFNMGGIGDLQIFDNGIQLKENSYVLDSLISSKITSRHGQPLPFEIAYNMSMVVSGSSGFPMQSMQFFSGVEEPNIFQLTASASQFQVKDLRDKALFTAEENQITVDSDILRVLQGGVRFMGSVQTPMLRSYLGSELMLESATRKLFVTAPTEVSIESRAADISVSCLTNLLLTSLDGKVKMKAPGIYIPEIESVPLLQPHPYQYVPLKRTPLSLTYQVCICSNGKLFVSQLDGECAVHIDGIQCR